MSKLTDLAFWSHQLCASIFSNKPVSFCFVLLRYEWTVISVCLVYLHCLSRLRNVFQSVLNYWYAESNWTWGNIACGTCTRTGDNQFPQPWNGLGRTYVNSRWVQFIDFFLITVFPLFVVVVNFSHFHLLFQNHGANSRL